MKMMPVESSVIAAVGYDPKTKTLNVLFNSGKTYAYQDVPQEEYDNLMNAESKGSYMRACIIDCYPDYLVSKKSRSRYR